MASTSTTNGEMLITIKMNVDGTSRRLKLPLRDLTRDTLEPKLRLFLELPQNADALFERYSDSAGAFIFLDRNNLSVYKQLGRAAKAKQKLKLRVTTRQPAVEEPKSGPKPASVEDAAEEDASVETIEVPQPPTQAEQTPAPPPPHMTPTRTETEDRQGKSLAALESTLEAIQSSIAAASAAAASASASSVTPINTEIAAVSPISAQTSSPVASIISGRTARTAFAVCCNSCDFTIPEVHYHCSTCDDGDFDLCQDCVDAGIACYGEDHWLIKRFVRNGQITNSTTERIAPKAKAAASKPASPAPAPPKVEELVPAALAALTAPPARSVSAAKRVIPVYEDRYSSIRTCNCCVQELSEANFVHCTTCEDFDLCRPCFAKNRHGHHPKHGFVPAVQGTRLENEVSRRLNPGRGQAHNAICDGCDEEIKGIRHKCLDCPDWDYCTTCIPNAPFIHPHHRFVPVYEELESASSARIRALDRATHYGICCDGPLCSSSRTTPLPYIAGDRYKCAVCDDTDFCANCEASPANNHNKTHPLIKFKTSVRHVNITTSVEHENGRSMSVMGDRLRSSPSAPKPPVVARTFIQTVVDVKPSAPLSETKIETPQVKSEEKEANEPLGGRILDFKVDTKNKSVVILKAPLQQELVATFVRDTVPDCTVLDSDTIFEQTWVLRNDGTVAWPAGCSVKYVGGDYMGHLDANRPAATQDLESSSESSISYVPVAPGEEHSFTVLLRTPQRTGRVVSNWRLTTKDGLKFGHRLWCDVLVRNTKPPASSELDQARSQSEIPREVETAKVETSMPEILAGEPAIQQSQMIFPKLEKESPETSIHEDAVTDAPSKAEEEYEDLASEDSWVEDEDSFLTDEEYDILDASDEESQHAA